MRLHVIYRSAKGASKGDVRPEYFDKTNCLKSFLLAYDQLPDRARGELVFLNDGVLPTDRKKIMENVDAEIIDKKNLGNSGSFRKALSIATGRKWNDEDLVYMIEDDYLHTPDAFTYLLHAAEDIPDADFFTLYDHPDRYTRTDNADKGKVSMFLSRDRHWRSVESTCMTFGARLQALRKEEWVFKAGTISDAPKDRIIFRSIQGLGKFWWKIGKKTLISPVPSLCTHVTRHFLAPFKDWEKVSEETEKHYG